MKQIRYIGERLGGWTIIGDPREHSNGNTQYPCRCGCGAEKWVFGTSLCDKTRPKYGCLKCRRRRESAAKEARLDSYRCRGCKARISPNAERCKFCAEPKYWAKLDDVALAAGVTKQAVSFYIARYGVAKAKAFYQKKVRRLTPC